MRGHWTVSSCPVSPNLAAGRLLTTASARIGPSQARRIQLVSKRAPSSRQASPMQARMRTSSGSVAQRCRREACAVLCAPAVAGLHAASRTPCTQGSPALLSACSTGIQGASSAPSECNAVRCCDLPEAKGCCAPAIECTSVHGAAQASTCYGVDISPAWLLRLTAACTQELRGLSPGTRAHSRPGAPLALVTR